VVDVLFIFYLNIYENKIIFNRKDLKSYRLSLRNWSTSAEAALWDILKSKNLDGDPHGEYHKIQEDENRDKYIESQSTTLAATILCNTLIIKHCGHSSFKRRGKLYELTELDIKTRLPLLILPVKIISDSLG
jgi:hypothetical protein